MALVGNLKDLKLPNLIQLNCLEKNVAKLTIEFRNIIGEIYFDKGTIIHAKIANIEGDQAVRELLMLKEGLFRIENGVKAATQTVETPWSNLLMDSLREIDEEKDTEKGKVQDLFNSILAIKGVLEAEILDNKGDLLFSSVDETTREGYSFLLVFCYKQGQNLSTLLNKGNMQFLNIRTPKSKIVCFKNNDKYIVAEYDSKLQIENLLNEIKKYQL